MRTYVVTTGAIFGLLVIAHIWRIVVEPGIAREPYFIISTLLAGAFTLWSLTLVRRSPSS